MQLQALKAEYRQRHGLSPETPPAAPTPTSVFSLAGLQARRDELTARLEPVGAALQRKKEEGDTASEQYQRWVACLESLLADYATTCEQVVALGGKWCVQEPCKGETCEECKALPTPPESALAEPIRPDALGVAWRVGLGAPYVFTTEDQVSGLALQLQRFAGAVPILALPTYAGSEDDNGQGDYEN